MAKTKSKIATREQSPDVAFLRQVGNLARQGLNQRQIAAELGIKATTTLFARLIRASQRSGRPVPIFDSRRGKPNIQRRVETVLIKRRGKGDSFAVNIPQEPLLRAGIKNGDQLKVTVIGGSVTLRK